MAGHVGHVLRPPLIGPRVIDMDGLVGAGCGQARSVGVLQLIEPPGLGAAAGDRHSVPWSKENCSAEHVLPVPGEMFGCVHAPRVRDDQLRTAPRGRPRVGPCLKERKGCCR